MKPIMAAFAIVLLCGFGWAQQSPPADGVGLGNDHLSPNGSISNVPSMSPDQNSVMSDSNGSVSGDKGISAFAGYGHADTATYQNAQGTLSVSESTSATAARRGSYAGQQGTQSTGAQITWSALGSAVDMNQNAAQQGNQTTSSGQNAGQKRKQGTGTAGQKQGQGATASGQKTYTDHLSGLNEGPSNTEAPGPHTGVPPAQPAPKNGTNSKEPAQQQQSRK